MKKNKTEEIEFIIDENNRVDFRQVLQMINMYEEKIQKKQAIIDKVIKLLGNYKHYSTPDEKQNSANEDLVNNVLDILKEAQNEKN